VVCKKMQPAVLLFLGGLATVAGYSAQNTYEELDQNVPFITWATLAMQFVGLLLVLAALYRVRPVENQAPGGTDLWFWIGVGATAVLFGAAVATVYTSNIFVALADLAGVLLLAAAIGRGAAMPSFIAGISAVALVASKRMVLPYEEERRVTHGPGMALLTLAWLGLAWALMLSVQAQPGYTVLHQAVAPPPVPTQVSLASPTGNNQPSSRVPDTMPFPGGVPDYGFSPQRVPTRSFSMQPRVQPRVGPIY